MKKVIFASLLLVVLSGYALVSTSCGSDKKPGAKSAAFAGKCESMVVDQVGVPGADPAWYFLVRELKHMGKGQFWEKDWATESGLETDPIPYMVDFKEKLEAEGVKLVLVPVPAKASIYPDKVDPGFEPGDPFPAAPFLAQIRAAGIDVIDLEPIFLKARAESGEKIFCEQDAHYSPKACLIAAQELKKAVQGEAWFKSQPKQTITRGPETELKITGDLIVTPAQKAAVPQEILKVQYAGTASGSDIVPVEPDADSPVLVLGDSHTLVFQEGGSSGMHTRGAGLLDQLQAELRFPVALMGSKGSGMVSARGQLVRQAGKASDGYWGKKKIVFWVFSIREFTQGDSLKKFEEKPMPIVIP